MGRPTKHALNSAATRARLIALGVERFPLKGYSATSVRDILRGSGLAIGAFYYHFESKDEFFLAILDQLSAEPNLLAVLEQAGASATLQEALLVALGPLVASPASGAMSLVVADFALAHKGDEAIRERVAGARRRSVAAITAFLAPLQSSGLVRRDLDPASLASMAFATIEGHVFHQEIYGTGFETALEATVRVLKP
jgi:TetR/AcrR family transcriptional repressor of nem operon